MTTFELYLLLMLPVVREFGTMLFGFGFFVSLATAVVIVLLSYLEDKPDKRKFSKKPLRYASWLSIPWLLCVLLPTKTVMYMLIGWELGTSIDGIENLPTGMVDYLNELIQQELGELRSDAAAAVEGGE